jgi:hypothetical protein
VQLARFPDGKRRVTHVTEVTGREGDTVTTQDLFVFRQHRLDEQGRVIGEMEPTGIMPTFIDAFKQSGITVDMGLDLPMDLRR